jgi:hypothetical protein
VKVFGIGLARTGTASLNQALRTLGFTSMHFPRSYGAIMQYECLTDTSVTVGYKYLDFMFADARFILTTRDMDSWLGSIRALFAHLERVGIADRYHRLHEALYGTRVFDEQRMRAAYRRHHTDVLDYFGDRPDLLVLDVTREHPYAALCEFLGREVPGSGFPHVNDRAAMASSRPSFDT